MTEYPTIIGITGRAGSGKSRAGDWFLRNHHQCTKLSFARPLKRMLLELIRDSIPKKWHVDPSDYINDPVLKNEPIPFLGNYTGRKLMQTLGTEWGRTAIHPDFWVGIAAGKIERTLGVSFAKSEAVKIKIIFDDLRFANEAEVIRAYGGTVIRIERPGQADPVISTHASEAFDFAADIPISNDGTLEDLYAKLAALYPPTATRSAS